MNGSDRLNCWLEAKDLGQSLFISLAADLVAAMTLMMTGSRCVTFGNTESNGQTRRLLLFEVYF